MASVFLDAAGQRRSPATLLGHRVGRPSRNKGLRYSADPPTIDGIVAVMCATSDRPDGPRLRALIVIQCQLGHYAGDPVKGSAEHAAMVSAMTALVGRSAGGAAVASGVSDSPRQPAPRTLATALGCR
ncbi:MAG: hypothetical protein ACP5H2_11380 [Solirubrobacteraceae bacterium]